MIVVVLKSDAMKKYILLMIVIVLLVGCTKNVEKTSDTLEAFVEITHCSYTDEEVKRFVKDDLKIKDAEYIGESYSPEGSKVWLFKENSGNLISFEVSEGIEDSKCVGLDSDYYKTLTRMGLWGNYPETWFDAYANYSKTKLDNRGVYIYVHLYKYFKECNTKELRWEIKYIYDYYNHKYFNELFDVEFDRFYISNYYKEMVITIEKKDVSNKTEQVFVEEILNKILSSDLVNKDKCKN